MLESLDGFLDALAVMIEIGEGWRRIACCIEPGSHQHAHLSG